MALKGIHLPTPSCQGVAMISPQLGSDFKYPDMTTPISLKPTDHDITEDLVKTLELHGCFEEKEETMHRMEILGRLNHLVKQWIKDISIV